MPLEGSCGRSEAREGETPPLDLCQPSESSMTDSDANFVESLVAEAPAKTKGRGPEADR